MRDKRRKSTAPGSESTPSTEAPELPERWSAERKTEVVLRPPRGEAPG